MKATLVEENRQMDHELLRGKCQHTINKTLLTSLYAPISGSTEGNPSHTLTANKVGYYLVIVSQAIRSEANWPLEAWDSTLHIGDGTYNQHWLNRHDSIQMHCR